jgi:hypothetical protein
MAELSSAIAQRQDQVTTTLATIRNRWDRRVGHVEATPVGRELSIAVRLDKCACNLPFNAGLASLADKKLTMLLSGVLRFTAELDGSEEIIYLDEFIARVSDCQLRLVYERDGIDQTRGILEDIWG